MPSSKWARTLPFLAALATAGWTMASLKAEATAAEQVTDEHQQEATSDTLPIEKETAAEQIEQQHFGCTYEATCMMKLVKRNVLFFLVIIAALTLFGGLA